MPVAIACPVKPFVFAMTMLSARGAEDAPQREDLGRGASAAGRGVGLVGDEDGLRGDGVAVDAPLPLGAGDEGLHHLRDVVHVEARAVEGAVAGDGREERGRSG